jgi:hypothetical protein
MTHNPTPAEQLAEALGRKRIADAVGVGLTAVSNAVVRGRFPSSWYVSCIQIASDKGLACPPDLFGMRATTSQNVDKPAKVKGAAA